MSTRKGRKNSISSFKPLKENSKKRQKCEKSNIFLNNLKMNTDIDSIVSINMDKFDTLNRLTQDPQRASLQIYSL